MFRILLATCLMLIGLSANGETMSDPTKPMRAVSKNEITALAKPVDTKFRLNAIKISNKETVATINGKVVKVGDLVGNKKIIEIKASKVVFEGGDGPGSLKFHGKVIKNPKTKPQEVLVQ